MEYRCRVATTTGQVMEATYIAESEARLRLELEEKGLYLLSVQGGSGLRLGGMHLTLPTRRRIPTSEFLVFNQELATLLKAGLPLVQSLDILRRRVPNPFFRAALDDVYEKVRSGTALSEAFESQKLFPPVYTASLMAGELNWTTRFTDAAITAYTGRIHYLLDSAGLPHSRPRVSAGGQSAAD